MNIEPTTSLMIAVYNWPEALEVCLNSVLRQTQMPDEIVIADDGSAAATSRVVDRYRHLFPVRFKHVWQPDEGFKLAQIRNKAVAASTCNYIIQIDGDLMLHDSFVKDHIAMAKAGHFVGGSRVILNPALSAKILSGTSHTVNLLNNGVTNRLNGLHFPILNRLLGLFVPQKGKENIRGCNMAYWKSDFIRVNGYNEDFQGWGKEDTDLILRFYAAGLKRIFFKFRGVVYHIHHKEADRSRLTANERLVHASNYQQYYCANGIDKYLVPPAQKVQNS